MNEFNTFNVRTLRVHFNKRANIDKIYEKIQKKYSLRERTLYAFVGFYKFKWNTLLICFSNQKVFIDDEKDKLNFTGVYTYKEIKVFKYVENKKQSLKSYIEITTDKHRTFRIKGISKSEFEKIINIFETQKKIYINSFLEKVSNTNQNGFDLINENYTYSSISNNLKRNEKEILNQEIENKPMMTEENKRELEPENPINNDSVIDEEPRNTNTNVINNEPYYNQSNNNNATSTTEDLITKSNLIVENIESSKHKKVVNDSLITNTNSFSSLYLVNLLTNEESLLPGGKKTIFSSLIKKIKLLESSSLALNGIDNTPINLDKKVLKLNTIPVIVETKPMNPQVNDEDSVENKLIFTRNWIEYTKHNVANKVLGVDENGNGVYIDMSKAVSSSTIDVYKAKEYKLNDELRSGLRSSQTISFSERNGRPGLDFFYTNLKTGEKLNVLKYDGIVFLGVKYYFNVYNEFSKLQKKYVRILVEEKKNNGDVFRRYELTFDDDILTYKAFNERSQIIDDNSINSNTYDLKWLTFFKD